MVLHCYQENTLGFYVQYFRATYSKVFRTSFHGFSFQYGPICCACVIIRWFLLKKRCTNELIYCEFQEEEQVQGPLLLDYSGDK